MLALAGCAGGSANGPVEWWHELEGGRIAQARPAPPRDDAPYPHLAQVPARPVTDDAAVRGRIATGLTRDRDNAGYGARIAPLPAPAARPSAEVDPDAAGATIPAATPIAARPVAPVAVSPTGSAGGTTAPESMLDIPPRPPAPPDLPGVARSTLPVAPPTAPVVPAAAAAPHAPRDPVLVAFAAGSAVLPQEAIAPLRGLAQARAGDDVVVVGFGEAEGAAALGLGFARAQAMTAALTRAGVPADAIRVTAEAGGHGGVARLVR